MYVCVSVYTYMYVCICVPCVGECVCWAADVLFESCVIWLHVYFLCLVNTRLHSTPGAKRDSLHGQLIPSISQRDHA